MEFTRPNAIPSWDQYKIFPWWIIEKSVGGEESFTRVFDSIGDETRFEGWGEDRQRFSLDQCVLSAKAHRDLRAFRRAVRGMAQMFLFRDLRECWMGTPNPMGFDLPPVKREFLGTGDGVRTDFQLRIYDLVQGDEVTRNVYFPNHAYSDLFDSEGNLEGPTERLKIWTGDTPRFDWGVARINSGMLRFDTAPAPGHDVWSLGSFFTGARFNQDLMKSTPQKGGAFFRLEGVEFIEPKGRK